MRTVKESQQWRNGEEAYNGDTAHTHGRRLTAMHQMEQRQQLQHLIVEDIVYRDEGGVGVFLMDAASNAIGHHTLLQVRHRVWRLCLCAV